MHFILEQNFRKQAHFKTNPVPLYPRNVLYCQQLSSMIDGTPFLKKDFLQKKEGGKVVKLPSGNLIPLYMIFFGVCV